MAELLLRILLLTSAQFSLESMTQEGIIKQTSLSCTSMCPRLHVASYYVWLLFLFVRMLPLEQVCLAMSICVAYSCLATRQVDCASCSACRRASARLVYTSDCRIFSRCLVFLGQ